MTPEPLSPSELAAELNACGVVLSERALARLSAYLELLLHWNRRINLVGFQDARRVVRELFGESLYLSRVVVLGGRLVDVGAGAGFPGLALKLAVPGLELTLVESDQRKCAFLKEVVREMNWSGVEVVGERFESWATEVRDRYQAEFSTTRAVKVRRRLLGALAGLLGGGGRAAFFTTAAGAKEIRGLGKEWNWEAEIAIPFNSRHWILLGTPQY